MLALTSAQWDITDATAAERFVASGDVVINCAAYTKVDAAEAEPARAHAVNAVDAENVAHACARAGAELIHISTDYVFSGDKRSPYEIDDETGPLSVYGRTKLAGDSRCWPRCPTRTSSACVDLPRRRRRRLRGDHAPAGAGDGPVDVVAPSVACRRTSAILPALPGGRRRHPRAAAACRQHGAVSRFEQAQAVFEEVGADPQGAAGRHDRIRGRRLGRRTRRCRAGNPPRRADAAAAVARRATALEDR